jgi:septal ring factor EnvC (AmiA/AmiB activator)
MAEEAEHHAEPEHPAESEHPALVMLRQLEARLDGLAEELMRVKGRLAYVESRLARLETECSALAEPRARTREAVAAMSLDISDVAPSLSPGQDQDEFAEVARNIRARRTGVHVLSDDERDALDAALRAGIVSHEEVAAFWKRRGIA